MKIPCQNRVPKEWGKGRSQTRGPSRQPPSLGLISCSEAGRLLAWVLKGAERQQAGEVTAKIFALRFGTGWFHSHPQAGTIFKLKDRHKRFSPP